jgi:hypothetical protein
MEEEPFIARGVEEQKRGGRKFVESFPGREIVSGKGSLEEKKKKNDFKNKDGNKGVATFQHGKGGGDSLRFLLKKTVRWLGGERG